MNDLFKLLDIKPRSAPAASDVLKTTDARLASSDPSTNFALVLDEWDIARGSQLSGKHSIFPFDDVAADFHAAAFQTDPQSTKSCVDQLRQDFVDQLLQTPEYKALHSSTQLNEYASELAALKFADQFVKLQNEKKPKPMSTMRAVNRALKAAQKEVDAYEEASNGLGGFGGHDNKMSLEETSRLFKRVQNSHILRRICELAGRFRLVAQSKQRQKSTHGYDDMVGVEMAGDIGRLLPVELAMLADKSFELDAMRRLVEKQTMCRQYRSVEKVGEGPIVVCVDESGSMSGEKICNAKAFALAMAWIARHQNRWCCLIGYSGGTVGTKIVLKPRQWNESALLDWLEHFYSGGTTMDVPLKELPTTYWKEINPPKGKTDVIIITDGIVNVPKKMEQDFNAWKLKEKVRCISLIINGYAGDLAYVSDEVHSVRGINVNEESVQKCLSI